MIAPVIHLNGTSAESLKSAWEETYLAIGEAVVKLRQCAPNGRDYYVHPQEDAISTAQRQHYDRIKRLRSVQDELTALCEAVDEGKTETES